MNLGTKLSDFWRRFQGELFPALTEEVGPLLGTHRRFVAAIDLVGVEGFLGTPGSGLGRPPEDRRALARAFLAKAVWDLPKTRHLIDRLGADPALRRLSVGRASGIFRARRRFRGRLRSSRPRVLRRGCMRPWWPMCSVRRSSAMCRGTRRPSRVGKRRLPSRRSRYRSPSPTASVCEAKLCRRSWMRTSRSPASARTRSQKPCSQKPMRGPLPRGLGKTQGPDLSNPSRMRRAGLDSQTVRGPVLPSRRKMCPSR